ncbi:HU family DNA-binding protein [Puniceibacterium sp. IMCC21224]|uniref:HU family DNA-binding protein n=1 Tax=Puniceibacterium sp. IMCC21224 TaxID=1618204 RepID=UPI00064E10D4|nr:HU family DNA-binding protein [Puniceibacterium sp. IMCC21224]KMK68561.1 bacterial nucleoid DNA-binding protein [Puniceibacterium sp. IMCC21224]
MSKTTKADLIDVIATECEINKTKTTQVIDCLISFIQVRAAAGDKVALPGFGQFEMRSRAARQGRNPATGEPIQIPESRGIVFKASKPVRKS